MIKMCLVITFCLLASVAMGQDNHVYEWTDEIGVDDEAINFRPVPVPAVTYEMDGANAKVLEKRPAPFAVINSLMCGAIVETEPDLTPAGLDGTWHKAIIDLSQIGFSIPKKGKQRLWLRYKFPGVDWSDEEEVIIEKRKAGKMSIVSGS